jgi:glutaredoxin
LADPPAARIPTLEAVLTALRAVLFSLATLLVPAAATVADDARPGADATPLQMYVLPDCGYCERARQHLRARRVVWQELDIAASPDARAAFTALGGAGTPLLVRGEARLHGFDPERLDAFLSRQGLVAP